MSKKVKPSKRLSKRIQQLITITCTNWNSGDNYDLDHTTRFDQEKKAA